MRRRGLFKGLLGVLAAPLGPQPPLLQPPCSGAPLVLNPGSSMFRTSMTGAAIKTGTIRARQIAVGSISVDKIRIAGGLPPISGIGHRCITTRSALPCPALSSPPTAAFYGATKPIQVRATVVCVGPHQFTVESLDGPLLRRRGSDGYEVIGAGMRLRINAPAPGRGAEGH